MQDALEKCDFCHDKMIIRFAKTFDGLAKVVLDWKKVIFRHDKMFIRHSKMFTPHSKTKKRHDKMIIGRKKYLLAIPK